MNKTLDEYHEENRRNESRRRGTRGMRGGRFGRGGRGMRGRGGRSQSYNDRRIRGSNHNQGNRRSSFTKDVRKRLHISNLSRAFQNADLRKMFEAYGTLKRCGIHFDQMGNSKGTADIEFENHESAAEAITKLNQAEINGVKVNVAFSDRAVRIIKSAPARQSATRKINTIRRRSYDDNAPRRRGRGRGTRGGVTTGRRRSRNYSFQNDNIRGGRQSTRQRTFKKTLGRRRRN